MKLIFNMENNKTGFNIFHAIFLLSGIAGLGYQIIWIRMFTTGLGHEIPSVLANVLLF